MTKLDSAGRTVPVGDAFVRAPGLAGNAIEVQPITKAKSRPTPSRRAFESALDRQGFVRGPAIALRARPVRGGKARVNESAAIDVEVPDPGPDFGEVLLQTDERGVVTWITAAPEEPFRKGGKKRRSFTVPLAQYPAATKGPGALVSKLLETFIFPRLAPAACAIAERHAAAWERQNRPYQLRSFTPENYSRPAGTLSTDELRRLSGKVLVFVHGTFARAHSAFASVPIESMQELHRRYNGQVIAFDHFTITEEPLRNAQRFIEALPEGVAISFDLVCHSRGGLVGRALAEQRSKLDVRTRQVAVDRVVFAGSPNAGCVLADAKAMSHWIDRYTNWAAWLPTPGVVDVIEGVLAVVKQLAVGVLEGMPGLQSMVPDGNYLSSLAGGSAGETQYFALASNYEPPSLALDSFAHNALMDNIFQEDNDLVVPTRSVWDSNGSRSFPIRTAHIFGREDRVDHGGYFSNPTGNAKILAWLTTAT